MDNLFDDYGKTLKKGEILFQEGDKADFMYHIHSGKIQISKKAGNEDKIIKILEEGEFVGEMAIINSAPRSATAVAVEDCKLISMDRKAFKKSIRDNHAFAVSVIQMLSERLRKTNEIITSLIMEA